MYLKIEGVRVLFQAVESFAFDQANGTLVVRTVSGKEYRRTVLNEAEADKIADAMLKQIAVFQSL